MAQIHIGGLIQDTALPGLARAADADWVTDLSGSRVFPTAEQLAEQASGGCITLNNASTCGLVCVEEWCQRHQVPYDLLLPHTDADDPLLVLWRPGQGETAIAATISGDPVFPLSLLDSLLQTLRREGPEVCAKEIQAALGAFTDLPNAVIARTGGKMR